MKMASLKRSALLFTIACSYQFCFSQTVHVSGTLNNASKGKVYLIRPAFPFSKNNVYQGFKTIALNEKGGFDIAIELREPEIMKAVFIDSAGNRLAYYNFYLTPGDNLKMQPANEKIPVEFTVTGRGANNNQQLAIYDNDSISNFNGDTLPGRAIAYLQTQNESHRKTLQAYVQKQHPSPAFVNAWTINLQYEVPDAYYTFSTGNAYRIRDAYERNSAAWDDITESLYKEAPLKNEAALVALNYRNFIKWYIIRTREKLWSLFNTNRSGFLAEWYGKDTAAGAALYAADKVNDLQQRIIERMFTGRSKEYLYAVLINGALAESEIENLIPIYEKYKMDFPSSTYLALFEQGMKDVAAKKERKLTPGIKFIDGSVMFKNWEDILAYYKGQTVLLDMWGTWCGPCRRDMDLHSTFIKAHFKGKPLTYVYIANNDSGKEKLWKELIAYFNLEGYHFIANKELTKDIMSKVKGQGYPTYVIIHKDGTFELYERGYGIDREVLIAQIENALKL